jgi:hypothetical protein
MTIEFPIKILSEKEADCIGHRFVEQGSQTTFVTWKMGEKWGHLDPQNRFSPLFVNGKGVLDAVDRLESHPGKTGIKRIGMDGTSLLPIGRMSQKNTRIVIFAPNNLIATIIFFQRKHTGHRIHFVYIKLAPTRTLFRTFCLEGSFRMIESPFLGIHVREDGRHVTKNALLLSRGQYIGSIAAGGMALL